MKKYNKKTNIHNDNSKISSHVNKIGISLSLMIFRLLGTEETQIILRYLLKRKHAITSARLLNDTNIPKTTFYNIIKQLVLCGLITKISKNNRHVSYQISPDATKIWNISDKLLDEIQNEFGIDIPFDTLKEFVSNKNKLR